METLTEPSTLFALIWPLSKAKEVLQRRQKREERSARCLRVILE